MNDDAFLRDYMSNSKISGPWRMTLWEKDGSPQCYLFSEEHSNEGSCPSQKGIETMAKEVLSGTDGVHVFVEHFVHALEITREGENTEQACAAKSKSILNNMRNCLEVIRTNTPDVKKRVHFVDPRMDIVAVLPDGKLYEAISFYFDYLVSRGDRPAAFLLLYESLVHPLLSILPEKFGVKGRMSGVMEKFRSGMTPEQTKYLDEVWTRDVLERVRGLTSSYASMQKTDDVSGVDNLKKTYTDMVNKFMDTWLLSDFFLSGNDGMTAAIVYAGSLHSLNFEEYLRGFGYRQTRKHENKSLESCLLI